jgi:Rieske Fe-S protein
MSDTTRREVLTTLAVCGCCMVAGSTAHADTEDRPGAFKAEKSKVGALTDFPDDGFYDQHARSKQIFIVRKGNTLYAPSSICTHKRCVLKKNDAGGLRCPCHKSEFDAEGIPLAKPAKISLPRYAITIENGDVYVDTSKSFEEKTWSDPAASATIG